MNTPLVILYNYVDALHGKRLQFDCSFKNRHEHTTACMLFYIYLVILGIA